MIEKPRHRDFHGFSVGDHVCVHGEGFGDIVAMSEGRYPHEDRVIVEVPRRDRHEPSGKIIEWSERFTRHPTNVSRSIR
jgi:hypothetical protein